MERAVKVFGLVVQAAGVAAVIDDNEHLRVFAKFSVYNRGQSNLLTLSAASRPSPGIYARPI